MKGWWKFCFVVYGSSLGDNCLKLINLSLLACQNAFEFCCKYQATMDNSIMLINLEYEIAIPRH